MITQTSDVFKIENEEYGFAYETAPPSNNFKMVIPKLMGNLSGKGPDQVNGGIFDNEVKPSYSKKVNRLDWIPVRFASVASGTLWETRLVNGLIPKGSRFKITFVNGDLSDLHVID